MTYHWSLKRGVRIFELGRGGGVALLLFEFEDKFKLERVLCKITKEV